MNDNKTSVDTHYRRLIAESNSFLAGSGHATLLGRLTQALWETVDLLERQDWEHSVMLHPIRERTRQLMTRPSRPSPAEIWEALVDIHRMAGGKRDLEPDSKWELFTEFLSSAQWRLRLPNRCNAWVTVPTTFGDDFSWTVEDNSCGQVLKSGVADTLEAAQGLAESHARDLEWL